MRKTDLLWIFAYPLYQIIGTFRHEAGHALAALLEGETITEFVFWPTSSGWGYVVWEGPSTVASIGAPYILDLLTFAVFFTVCMTVVFRRRWVWINAVAIGIISPLINSAYNYRGGLRSNNDVGWLFKQISPGIVHGYFWLTMLAYFGGLILVFTVSEMARASRSKVVEEGGA
jgi:hypothetical protein